MKKAGRPSSRHDCSVRGVVRTSILAGLVLLVMATSARAQRTVVEVNAGPHARALCIIEVKLRKPLKGRYPYQARNTSTERIAPVQPLADGSVMFVLPDTLPAGTRATYALERAAANQTPFGLIKDENSLSVHVAGKPVLQYHITEAKPPVGAPAYYARSGFVHPLYTPSGNVLTDDFPVGHAHQHGIMMAWVSTRFRNTNADFWNQHLRTANVRHADVLSLEEGPVYCRARIELQHYVLPATEVLREVWTLTVYPFSGFFLFDLQSVQTNTTTDTLFLNKYHYGGMAFRGSRQWNAEDSAHFTATWKISTDSGYTLANANGKHAAYVSAAGLIDGRESGVTVYGFPGNFRYPQAIRVHPTMPYWCYAPVVDGAFGIAPKATYRSRYRYFVYDGLADEITLQNLYNDIHQSPEARQIR